MLDIVALVASSDARARIITSVGRRAKRRLVSSPRDLADAVAHTMPSAVICEFSDETGAGAAAAVRELRSRRPALPMIGYCWVEAHASRHLMVAARAGVSALALRGVDDIGAMLDQLLVEAETDCVSDEVARALGGRVPRLVHDALDYCIRQARELPDVARLAESLHLPRRTLGHRLQRAGVPSAAALISWSRLFLAAKLLVDDARPVEQAAHALGFASGSALRGMLRRYAGVTPRELREDGGLTYLVELFVEGLACIAPVAGHVGASSLPTAYQPCPLSDGAMTR
ncbi:MAG: helix-turn-helix domain-containing protein [Gemmatimonadaceae bacterium]|nr:helix-turn-helix domain-containing protein [Gemmatimonadaceae bacterium]